MVQRQNPSQGGDFFRENFYRNERFNISQDSQFVSAPAPPPVHTASVHTRPQTIEDALKTCVRIPVKTYALIVHLENGDDRVYSSASLTEYRDRIFTDAFKNNFRKSVRRATASSVDNHFSNHAFYQDGGLNHFDGDVSNSDEYTKKHANNNNGSSSDAKKRRLPNYRARREPHDSTPIPIPIRKSQQLRIGDGAEVERFYLIRFKDMQQTSCKIMGKVFVKLVEPKKQTHHPYTRGDEKKPPWWPNTSGENHVRHVEPDHLLRPERIRLCVHILKMITEPYHNQHPSIQKLGLNINKLEEVTMEALSSWFNDKECPKNALKRPFLKEIFKIAKAEERYKRDEIDGSTYFSIMYGEPAATEDEEADDEDSDEVPASAIPASISSPGSMISPTTGQAPQLHESDMRVRVPMRLAQLDDQPQYSDNAAYYNSRSMSFNSQSQSPTSQERRQFIPTSSYSSPQPNIYGGAWPMMTNGSSTGQSYYVTSPQQAMPQLPPISQQHTLPLPALPGYQDHMPRYDTAPALGSTLRTGSMSHPHQHPQHMSAVFANPFLQDNGAFSQNDNEMKVEPQQHLHHSQQ